MFFRFRRAGIVSASLYLSTLTALAADSDSTSFKCDPSSGLEFPTAITRSARAGGLGADVTLTLLEVAQRKMWYVFSTYALGLYIDERRAREALQQSGGNAAVAICSDFGKALRLRPVRDTEGSHIRKGFATSLQSCNAPADAIKEFEALVPKQLKKGDVLEFLWKEGGVLEVQFNGVTSGIVESLPLCVALFKVYLVSEQPKVPEIKESWFSWVAKEI